MIGTKITYYDTSKNEYKIGKVLDKIRTSDINKNLIDKYLIKTEDNKILKILPTEIIDILDDYNLNIKTAELQELPECTRVEVITNKGREFVSMNKDNKIKISFQDDNKTLKIFILN